MHSAGKLRYIHRFEVGPEEQDGATTPIYAAALIGVDGHVPKKRRMHLRNEAACPLRAEIGRSVVFSSLNVNTYMICEICGI